MNIIYPRPLQPGDTIMVIAPSSVSTYISPDVHEAAIARWNSLGINVVFAPNFDNTDDFATESGIKKRVDDIHTAFSDKNIAGVFTVLGGYHSNQLLKHLDFELIRNNPKVFCGFSDITALNNAIFAKTGLITFCGPHYSTFGMIHGLDFTVKSFQDAIMQTAPFHIGVSDKWSDDPWYRDQENRKFIPNPGAVVLNGGTGRGRLLGGNQCTFALLQGTEYMPSDIDDIILFVEDDSETTEETFLRQLAGLLTTDIASHIRGVIMGRFQPDTPVDINRAYAIIKNALGNVPVVANLDFGHTTPMLTIPTGAMCDVTANGNTFDVTIYHE